MTIHFETDNYFFLNFDYKDWYFTADTREGCEQLFIQKAMDYLRNNGFKDEDDYYKDEALMLMIAFVRNHVYSTIAEIDGTLFVTVPVFESFRKIGVLD